MSSYPGIQEANVYGVEIPGKVGPARRCGARRAPILRARGGHAPPRSGLQDGRAGMAAVVMAPNIDLAGLGQHLSKHLPPYAVPVFLRALPQYVKGRRRRRRPGGALQRRLTAHGGVLGARPCRIEITGTFKHQSTGAPAQTCGGADPHCSRGSDPHRPTLPLRRGGPAQRGHEPKQDQGPALHVQPPVEDVRAVWAGAVRPAGRRQGEVVETPPAPVAGRRSPHHTHVLHICVACRVVAPTIFFPPAIVGVTTVYTRVCCQGVSAPSRELRAGVHPRRIRCVPPHLPRDWPHT